MKFCMSHYSHKRITEVKFESGSFSKCWRCGVTKFPSQEGNKPLISDIHP